MTLVAVAVTATADPPSVKSASVNGGSTARGRGSPGRRGGGVPSDGVAPPLIVRTLDCPAALWRGGERRRPVSLVDVQRDLLAFEPRLIRDVENGRER